MFSRRGCRPTGDSTACGVVLVAAFLLVGCAGSDAVAVDPPAFRGERALEWIEAQCALGPRPPGSPALEALRALILTHADSLGLEAHRLPFTARSPLTGGDVEAFNLVIRAGPKGGDRLWLGAHYDTRPVADHDREPDRRDEPILGANDGGSGTAVLLHLAELLAAMPPPRGVDLVFFDLEDSGRPGDPQSYCLGSQHLAATWREFGSHLAGCEPRALVLLDMVGRVGLRIPQEGYSLRFAPELTAAVFERAMELGLTALIPAPGPAVFDDHVPFLMDGLPAVNLIDFEFPEWHTLGDTPAVCDAASLEQVGRLVADLCYRPLKDF